MDPPPPPAGGRAARAGSPRGGGGRCCWLPASSHAASLHANVLVPQRRRSRAPFARRPLLRRLLRVVRARLQHNGELPTGEDASGSASVVHSCVRDKWTRFGGRGQIKRGAPGPARRSRAARRAPRPPRARRAPARQAPRNVSKTQTAHLSARRRAQREWAGGGVSVIARHVRGQGPSPEERRRAAARRGGVVVRVVGRGGWAPVAGPRDARPILREDGHGDARGGQPPGAAGGHGGREGQELALRCQGTFEVGTQCGNNRGKGGGGGGERRGRRRDRLTTRNGGGHPAAEATAHSTDSPAAPSPDRKSVV